HPSSARENGGSFMLVLTRKSNESVIVGDHDSQRILSVTVLQITPGKVKLGFDAANGVAVHRSEVWARISAPAPQMDEYGFTQEGSGDGNRQASTGSGAL